MFQFENLLNKFPFSSARFLHWKNIDKLFREIPEDQDTAHMPSYATNSRKYTPEEIMKRFQKFEELRFENVHFRYTEDGPWVLQGVSFIVRKGDRLAIVGATGSGKIYNCPYSYQNLYTLSGFYQNKWCGALRNITGSFAVDDSNDAAGFTFV